MSEKTPKTTVLALPGTGYPRGGDGVTESFLAAFDEAHYDTRVVAYPADFGATGSREPFVESTRAGRTALLDAVDELKGRPVVIAGYSQGAVIAGDLAREIASTRKDTNVKACALIADGYRPEGKGVVPPGMRVSEGYGIAGQRDWRTTPFPVFWVSAWGDPIASLPAGNPLRGIADMIEWYSVRSPADAYRWGAAMLDRAASGRLQDWWNPTKWRKWNSALAFSRGFLFDGRHGDDYVQLGYTRALANAVMNHLEK